MSPSRSATGLACNCCIFRVFISACKMAMPPQITALRSELMDCRLSLSTLPAFSILFISALRPSRVTTLSPSSSSTKIRLIAFIVPEHPVTSLQPKSVYARAIGVSSTCASTDAFLKSLERTFFSLKKFAVWLTQPIFTLSSKCGL